MSQNFNCKCHFLSSSHSNSWHKCVCGVERETPREDNTKPSTLKVYVQTNKMCHKCLILQVVKQWDCVINMQMVELKSPCKTIKIDGVICKRYGLGGWLVYWCAHQGKVKWDKTIELKRIMDYKNLTYHLNTHALLTT